MCSLILGNAIFQGLPGKKSLLSKGKDLHDIVRNKVTTFESLPPSRGS